MTRDASRIFALALACAAIACHAKRTRPAAVPAANLAIVAIDDSVDPFATLAPASPPSDVTIQDEPVPLGAGREVDVHYARTVVRSGETGAAARARLGRWLVTLALPPGARFEEGVVHDAPGSAYARSYVVAGPVVVASADLEGAEVADGEMGKEVAITLLAPAARRFEDFTRAWLQRRAAIVIDGDVMSTPCIRTPIAGGRLRISLAADDPEAADHLALALRPSR